MTRRRALQVLAVLALPVALALVVLAVDVLRLPGTLESRDLRFEGATRRADASWGSVDFLRGWPAARILEVDDDLAYRRAVKLLARVKPGKYASAAPSSERENVRGVVLRQLTDGSASDPNPKRRSRYLNFMGAMLLEQGAVSQAEFDTTLRRAIFTFRDAVLLDPENTDARTNLELALRAAKAVALPGTDPQGGQADGTLSGEGRSGSGY